MRELETIRSETKCALACFGDKAMLAVILSSIAQFLNQFSRTIGADILLLLILIGLVFIDMALGFMTMLKTRNFSYGGILNGIFKLPLYALYLFLIGCIGISIEHSIQVVLPILNLFIAYLIVSEVFIIVVQLQKLQVRVPNLLIFLVGDFKSKFENRLRNLASGDGKITERKEAGLKDDK